MEGWATCAFHGGECRLSREVLSRLIEDAQKAELRGDGRHHQEKTSIEGRNVCVRFGTLYAGFVYMPVAVEVISTKGLACVQSAFGAEPPGGEEEHLAAELRMRKPFHCAVSGEMARECSGKERWITETAL